MPKGEALAVVERGVVARGIEPGKLVLGTDNGTAYTSRGFRARLRELEIAHRRGGYGDPESQAFIESWFSKLKERLIWREEFETLDQARAAIGAYVERSPPPRPVSRLPHPEGGETDLGGCPGYRSATKPSGLRCQRRGGPGQHDYNDNKP